MGNQSTKHQSQEDFATLTISQQRDKFKQMIQSAENDIDKKLKAITPVRDKNCVNT